MVGEHATSTAAISPAPGRSRSPTRAAPTTAARSKPTSSRRPAITIGEGSVMNDSSQSFADT